MNSNDTIRKMDTIINTDERNYIFLGHIYDWQSNGEQIDPRVEDMDFSLFDEIWLGGDICAATTQKPSTIIYLDQKLGVSSPNTLWALGNHDVVSGNTHLITDVTGRKTFYTSYNHGITKMVINTTLEEPAFKDSCQLRQEQYNMLFNVMDTINSSSHLVLIMHNVVWSDIEDNMNLGEAANAWAAGVDFLCQEPAWFRLEIYPALKEVQERGVQVVIISGDGGQYQKTYHHTLPIGIEFYVSGINNSHQGPTPSYSRLPFNKDPDSILVFKHDLFKKTLIGTFEEL